MHAELESLAAPIAHYPEPLLTYVLQAAGYPAQVLEAARYGASVPNLHPSVRALLDHPGALEYMARHSAWMFDLGNAHLAQAPQLRYALKTVAQPDPPPPVVVVGRPIVNALAPRKITVEERRYPNGPPSIAAQLQAKDAEEYRKRAVQAKRRADLPPPHHHHRPHARVR